MFYRDKKRILVANESKINKKCRHSCAEHHLLRQRCATPSGEIYQAIGFSRLTILLPRNGM